MMLATATPLVYAWGGKDARRDLHSVQILDMDEDTTMTVRELRAALATMKAQNQHSCHQPQTRQACEAYR